MKKILILTLVALFTVSVSAADKFEKNKAKTEKKINKQLPLVLQSSSDTLSYAAGVMVTNGLMQYLNTSEGIDSTNLHHFIDGALEYFKSQDNAEAKARIAGMAIAKQVSQQMMPNIRKDFSETPDSIVEQVLYRAFLDAIIGSNTLYTVDEATKKFEAMRESNKQAKFSANRTEGEAFLAENAKKEGVVTTASGLQYKIIKKGEGDIPTKDNKVSVHYEGKLVNGHVFDASRRHGTAPLSFRANQVIKGWTEALTMMPVGSVWELYIPQNLGYGERQAGTIPPYSTLIFTVELLGIED